MTTLPQPEPPLDPSSLLAFLPGFACGALPDWGLIRAEGPEAMAFLQAQLSNDLNAVSRQQAQLAGYCSAKGRLLTVLTVSRLDRDGGYGLELPTELLAASLKRLRMYLLRSKLSLDDASASLPALAVAGSEAGPRLQQLGLPVPEGALACARDGDLQIIRRPGAWPRFLLRAPAERLQTLRERLGAAAPLDSQHWRLAELLAGIPVVRSETVEHFVPQTVDLDLAGGISFSKGCYPGQEIVARVHYLGRLKQRLHLGLCDAPATPGCAIYAEGESGQAVGEIMDSAPLPDGRHAVALSLNLSHSTHPGLHLGAVDGPRLSALGPSHR